MSDVTGYAMPSRLYTWVDVDDHLTKLATTDVWPGWLQECDAFWDSMVLTVTDSVSINSVVGWIESVFGPGSVESIGGQPNLVLEGLPSKPSTRYLPIYLSSESMLSPRREPRWRAARVTRDIAEPIPHPGDAFASGVHLAALHSFKGGVGRTLHGVALAAELAARGPILLVDGDLEAPGITWMYEASGKRTDFAYEDFLALLHSSQDGSPDEAVRLGAAYLPNQSLHGVIVMPARRDLARVGMPRIEPGDLITPGRSPYFLNESLAALGAALGVSTVLVDLRAGVSELSASLLLDPRVKRIFVTTVSAQSIDGTAAMIREVSRRAPSTNDDPSVSLIVTQYSSGDSEDRLEEVTSPLRDAVELERGRQAEDGTDYDEISSDLVFDPVFSVFQESLLGLPAGWDDIQDLVRSSGLRERLASIVNDLSPERAGDKRIDGTASDTGALGVQDRRHLLFDYSGTLAYAETTDVQDFLATDSLRNLVTSHRTEVPLCVVTGSKGAGKTFTQLQMCYRRTWAGYAEAVGIDGVTLDALLVPVLTSQNLSDQTAQKIDDIREGANVDAAEISTTRLDLRDAIQDGLAKRLTEREWRGVWLSSIARSVGLAADFENAEQRLTDLAKSGGKSLIFVVDGLEDILQEVATNSEQQRALRVLLTDCLDWLRSLRGRPLGLIVLVRRDLVRAAIPQNSEQFFSRYREYELTWNPSEAVRLALWVTHKSGALADMSMSSVVSADDDRLTAEMIPVWGEKMGTARSREARSRGWFLAALSDFNGGIQARDIVTFLKASAEGSIGDERWAERLLTPAAMREALVECSRQKIQAISEETPQIKSLLDKLRALPDTQRQVPFTREESRLDIQELQLLVDNGVVFREEDRYWIPEIFRHGLGFRAVGRPRIVAVANLVRRRNNQD